MQKLNFHQKIQFLAKKLDFQTLWHNSRGYGYLDKRVANERNYLPRKKPLDFGM